MVSTVSTDALARRGKLYRESTSVGNSTCALAIQSTDAVCLPGFQYATANTYYTIPITYPGEDMFLNIIYNGPCTNSTIRYAQVAVQLRPSSIGGYNDSTGGSTKQSAFKYFTSTDCFLCSSTQSEAFCLGPLDTFNFACSTSAGEQHMVAMVGYSTAAAGAATAISTLSFMSTTPPIGCYFMKPMVVKSPF